MSVHVLLLSGQGEQLGGGVERHRGCLPAGTGPSGPAGMYVRMYVRTYVCVRLRGWSGVKGGARKYNGRCWTCLSLRV